MLLSKRSLRARAEHLSASPSLSALLRFSVTLPLMLLLRGSPIALLCLRLPVAALSMSMLCTTCQQECHSAVKVSSRSKRMAWEQRPIVPGQAGAVLILALTTLSGGQQGMMWRPSMEVRCLYQLRLTAAMRVKTVCQPLSMAGVSLGLIQQQLQVSRHHTLQGMQLSR